MEQARSYVPCAKCISIYMNSGAAVISTSIKGSIIKAIPDIGKVIDDQTQAEMSTGPTQKSTLNLSKLLICKSLTHTPCPFKVQDKVMVDRGDEICECANAEQSNSLQEGHPAVATLILNAITITLHAC